MTPSIPVSTGFNDADLLEKLLTLTDTELNSLPFGVIGFDFNERVVIYNDTEAADAALIKADVMGGQMFYVVAPCMNNYLVAERFRDVLTHRSSLDETLDYVLTLRMRPTPVKMRMLAKYGVEMRYLLINRKNLEG